MSLRVIDARSGEDVQVGQIVNYPDGEWIRLDDVRSWFFGASALITAAHKDYTKNGGPIVVKQQRVPLAVRFLHPGFPGERVAFIPS